MTVGLHRMASKADRRSDKRGAPLKAMTSVSGREETGRTIGAQAHSTPFAVAAACLGTTSSASTWWTTGKLAA